MNKLSRGILAALLLFGLETPLLSQLTLTTSLVNANGLDVFFLKDFDISRPGAGPPIFIVNIQNNSSLPQLVILRMSAASRRRGNLSRGETVPFTVPLTGLRLNNNDLFTNSGLFRFDRYQVDEAIVNDLLKDILATTRLPSDIYTFIFELRDANGNSLTPPQVSQFDIRITNPNRLDLIFPGQPATGVKEDCQVVFTHLPQFRWESDLRLFRLVVAEARPGEDPESALTQGPRLVRNFAVTQDLNRPASSFDLPGDFQLLPSSAFQFPPSGSQLTLQPGRAYYWRVIGFVETSSGPVEIPSEIFCFRLARFDRLGTGDGIIISMLQNFLGADFEKLFGEGGELYGYEPKRLTFDGKQISVSELIQKMPTLRRRYSGYRVEN